MNILFGILSPTYFLAGHLKDKCNSKDERKKLIKFLNYFYLVFSIFSILLIIFYQNSWVPLKKYPLPYSLFQSLDFLYYVTWFYFVFSRCNEIFISFLIDASAKIQKIDNTSSLEFKERLILAFKSYLELTLKIMETERVAK